MREFSELKVWAQAHALTVRVYRVTHDYLQEERDGLKEEMRCTARRVPSAIAEGCGQPDDRDLTPYLEQAVGALSALEYVLILAVELGHLPEPIHLHLAGDVAAVRKMLLSAIGKLAGR